MFPVFGILAGAVILYLIVGIIVDFLYLQEQPEGIDHPLQLPLWPAVLRRARQAERARDEARRVALSQRAADALQEVASHFAAYGVTREVGEHGPTLWVTVGDVSYEFEAYNVATMAEREPIVPVAVKSRRRRDRRKMVLLNPKMEVGVLVRRHIRCPDDEDGRWHDAGGNEVTMLWLDGAHEYVRSGILWAIEQDLASEADDAESGTDTDETT